MPILFWSTVTCLVSLGVTELKGSKMALFCFKVTVAKATVQRPPGLASKRRESVNPILIPGSKSLSLVN